MPKGERAVAGYGRGRRGKAPHSAPSPLYSYTHARPLFSLPLALATRLEEPPRGSAEHQPLREGGEQRLKTDTQRVRISSLPAAARGRASSALRHSSSCAPTSREQKCVAKKKPESAPLESAQLKTPASGRGDASRKRADGDIYAW